MVSEIMCIFVCGHVILWKYMYELQLNFDFQPATSGVAKPRRRNENLGGIGEGSPVKEFKPRAQRKTDEERQYRIHYNEDGRVGCYQCL